MRVRALLLAALAAASIPAVPAWGAVETGCQSTEAGYRCIYGPFEAEPGSNQFIVFPAAAPPEPGYITSARATLVDEDGMRISHHMVHLHHAVWLNTTKQDTTCPTNPLFRERFFATGKERTPLSMPQGYGYYWSGLPTPGYEQYGPAWAVVAELDGMHQGHTMDAYLRLNLGFTPGLPGTLTDITPIWLDVRNCQTDPVFDVPQGGRRFREAWTYEMPAGGEFVAMAGHLHDGGIRLVLRNLTTGERVYTSEALYDNPRRPWYLSRMTGFSRVPGVPVAQGDMLKLVAVYDSTHRWDDVMGIMVGALAPASG